MGERTTRPARTDDLDAIAALTCAHRHGLAEWSPQWWPVAPNADEVHRAWLGHLVASPDVPVRVVEEHGAVVGCMVAIPQPHQWFVDDVAVADERRWPELGPDLFGAITERPALTCIASRDLPRTQAARSSGLEPVSSYWIRTTVSGAVAPGALVEAVPEGPTPRHTFGAPFDPMAAGALALATADGVVDRITGRDRSRLLTTALAAARERGDILLAVVCAQVDVELQQALRRAGFERTVEVFAWSDEAPEPITR